ncbi:MAG: baseplate J/gp47 family protein [Clostridia bacterium]|nr:baseplate J/gp47 family protein [Clostridia bacterium]
MPDLKFIETDAGTVLDTVLEELENGVNEPLYPGDERRITGETLAQIVVAVYNSVNDACRQKMLRHARHTVLDAIGETRDCYRRTPTPATVTLRFGVTEPVPSNIIIPAGLRVTGDFVHYFTTDATVVLIAGTDTVDVTATAEEGGADYNDIAPGAISKIVDVSEVPLIDTVTNLDATEGGADEEGDEPYRERIREAENRLSTAGPAKAYKYWALSANTLVSDAVVESETETVERTLKTYAGHAFQGGANLLPDTLIVYLPDGTPAAADTDYTATYEDELLTLALSGALADAAEVKIEITRVMYGRVKIVPICAGGEIPDEEVLQDVLEACTAADVKPLTDYVQVEAPSVVYYDIELTYYTTKANQSEVVKNVEGDGGAIDQYIYWQGSALDRDINPDELRARILRPDWEDGLVGATRCEIVKPAFTELPGTTVARFSGNLKVSHVVKD